MEQVSSRLIFIYSSFPASKAQHRIRTRKMIAYRQGQGLNSKHESKSTFKRHVTLSEAKLLLFN